MAHVKDDLQIGAVVISEEFAEGRNWPGGAIHVGTSQMPVNAFDASRGSAEFVVIHTGVVTEHHGRLDGKIMYKRAQSVTAQRLTPEGTYDPQREKIFFHWNVIGIHGFNVKNLRVVRMMEYPQP